ncbi:amidase domain-containing protein [Gracilibacillus salinarum]|uniref:Amidase domain-containing protein n=1 Tax=Gracilibacillus salinarum TaxID=2932255 RepID=A0ABY4GNT6_9BACI|nr:amidase domain-containing protein [Gracilibacillus salinarum]UOQ85012.1 amidase domain-containing protein [Gracilibacillus salinarum]
MSEWDLVKQYWKKSWHYQQPLTRKKELHQKNGKKMKHLDLIGYKQHIVTERNQQKLHYRLLYRMLIDDHGQYYHEEMIEERVAALVGDQVVADQEKKVADNTDRPKIIIDETRSRFDYDRRAAVQYAERWWNDANPAYRYFAENDCTNYISQCMRAGGAPMTGAPNRSKGWWYQGNNWSYSWSVANSFRWNLSGATSGLKGTEVSDPRDLLPGDVICYDFEGDGRWDHNTIVVAKDSQNMPLVNAHTNNSRHRYWTYEDSAAWTPECDYRFFRIG